MSPVACGLRSLVRGSFKPVSFRVPTEGGGHPLLILSLLHLDKTL